MGDDETTAGITHALLAVDRSGSMAELAGDVRGGFNAYLDQLAEDGGDYRLTVLLFDHEARLLTEAACPLAQVPRLTRDNYVVRGNTALYDAIGYLITQFERHFTLGEQDRVLLVVQTDGKENSSREYTAAGIRAMIDQRVATGRWMTVYLGAGPDAWGAGESLGMQSVNTARTSVGTRSTYESAAAATRAYAAGVGGDEVMRSFRAAADRQGSP